MMSLLDGSGMTGDIWSTGAFAMDSPLKDLLDSGNFTIEQLLAEDELLQELRGLHPQLLDYFATEEAVTSLVRYLIIDSSSAPPRKPEERSILEPERDLEAGPVEEEEKKEKPSEPGKWLFQHLEERSAANTDKHPENDPENRYIRFPYMACEIVCCELQGVINVLVDGYIPENEKQATSTEGHEQEGAFQEDKSPISQKEEGRKRILDLLFSVLYETPQGELDDYRAGYLEKILSVLFRKRPQALSEYMNNGGGRGNVTLMKSMFKHLYSHSIMQLVQRLLLPQPPHLQQEAEQEAIQIDQAEDDDLRIVHPSDEPGLAGEAAPGSVIVEDADDESKTLQCNWSESEAALDLLLQPLIYPNATPSFPTSEPENAQKETITPEEEERRLNLCQNSSEVVITIIQNSPLNSQTMLRLTVDPILEKLIVGASTLPEGAEFSPHESALTATMNVLESLILQLGGYGSVGTISLLPTEEGGQDGDAEKTPPPQFADLQTLLIHIPKLLKSLSKLLLHPSCDNWRSPMQFSKPSEPQLLLGMSRLRIVRLLESLVLLGESNVDSLLCQSDCLEICLDLFWKFQWCSMLHQSVANLLVHVFEGADARAQLQEYFLVKCNLLGRLMDSFSEVGPGESGYILRDNVPVSNQEAVVIGMKGLNMGQEKCSSTEAQANSNSEERIPVSDDDVEAALEQQAETRGGGDGATAAAAMAELAERNGLQKPKEQREKPTGAFSVGQVSTEAVHYESRDASTVGAMLDGAPAQSFRLGYMGHVIIICQALVHACSTPEGEDEELEGQSPDSLAGEDADEAEARQSLLSLSDPEEAYKKMNGELPAASDVVEAPPSEPEEAHSNSLEEVREEALTGRDDGESARGVDSITEGVPRPNPLILSKIIDSHPLSTRWHEFIKTTLATETAIQSTPLGGFNNNANQGGDPLHAHHPLGDGEFDDDFGSSQPNMPPRGMLGGGDVIDMDDNDLDIAASMMAGLHLARGDDDDNDDGNDSSDDEESDGSGNTYDSGRKSAKKGYFFDDPLGGGKKSGLGLALGNLGQYHANGSDEENNSSEEGEGSDHSSDEGNDDQPRTMNLFAGNMASDAPNDATAATPFDDPGWSNFANFDDAFADQGGFPSTGEVFPQPDTGFAADFGSAEIQKPANQSPFSTSPPGPATEAIDEIFGAPKTHAILLDETVETELEAKILPDEKVDGSDDPAQESPELLTNDRSETEVN